MPDNLVGLLQQHRPVGYPFLMNGDQQIPETDHPAACGFGKIGSGEKRLLISGHKDAGRPAAASRERLTDCHIYAVNVGMFFLVNFD